MVQHEHDHSGEENGDERDSASLARIVRLISGDHLLTVNPVDGSEIETCPPGLQPGAPRRRATDERPHAERPATDDDRPVTLLERDEERERLTRLLGRGRSVRLTGPRGSGRTTLLDAVAADVAALAPDGVVRLSGYHRNVTDVLHDLFAAVYDAPDQRPDRRRLREALSTVGAVVILDDLEFGGGTLDELLTATPECAYLVATTPEVAAPSEKARIEEVFLPGLSRTGSLELLERVLDRPLTDDESDWAGDLWFLSEGKPLTFVQAAALLRQHGGGTAVAVYGQETADGGLPSGIDLVPDIAAGLSRNAREALRVAIALGGELPKGTHLPALLREDHADEAPRELADAGLVTEAGGHFRLADGVARQLGASYEDDFASRVESVAHHYAWWVAHPSVAATRVAAEADAVVATVAAVQRGGRAETAVLLARAAAPVLAAASRWGAWERVLRSGQEAARTAGDVAEQGYFHHELGVLSLCQDNPERARTELDASIALRAALADKHGTVAGRRALALVTDRLAAAAGGAVGALGTPSTPTGPAPAAPVPTPPPAGPTGPVDGPSKPSTLAPEPDDTPTAPTPKALDSSAPAAPASAEDATAAALSRATAMDESIAAMRAAAQEERGLRGVGGRRGLALRGTRKNVLAAGAGAVLAAVLGTVVTLGAASDSTEDPSGGPAQPDQTSLTDDYSEDPTQPQTDADPDPSTNPDPDPAKPDPSSEATPSPTQADNPGAPADDPAPTSNDDPATGGGGDGGPDGGSDPGTVGGGDSGGSTGGTGGDDGTEPSPSPSTTEPTTEPSEPEPSPSSPEESPPSDDPATDGGQAGGDSSSPTASGPAPSDTPTGATPTGTASGGTGAPVV